MVDEKAVREHIRGLLRAIGEDPDRPGLVETPDRVARMFSEVFAGTGVSNSEIVQTINKTFDNDETTDSDKVIAMKDIDIFSYCEHHMALMYDMKVNVAYIPRGKVIGLSKIVRACEMAAKRLQLQERLTKDIADIISEMAQSPDVAVTIEGCHSCVRARGIKNHNARTFTAELRGRFKEDRSLCDLLK